jgi:glycosyltransferase involved in cell wall biosynthesis
MKKIEVLMAVFNGEKYIAEQMDSILRQTYSNIHLIVRDNCSTDSTQQIVEQYIQKYPDKITLLVSSKNVGVVGNFAALIDHAKADYVMFSDHDDIWLPQKIEKTFSKMIEMEKQESPSTPLLVHTDLTVVNERLETIHPSFWKYSKLDPKRGQTLPRLLLQNQVTGCTMMINKPMMDLARPIPENIVMHDWWMALFAVAFGKIGIVNEATMLYRQHGKNDTGAQRYSLSSFIRKRVDKSKMEKIQKCQQLTVQQAELFLERNFNRLEKNAHELIKAFISFEESHLFRKALLMFKYGFYRVGLVRNLGLVFGSRNLRGLLGLRKK